MLKRTTQLKILMVVLVFITVIAGGWEIYKHYYAHRADAQLIQEACDRQANHPGNPNELSFDGAVCAGSTPPPRSK